MPHTTMSLDKYGLLSGAEIRGKAQRRYPDLLSALLVELRARLAKHDELLAYIDRNRNLSPQGRVADKEKAQLQLRADLIAARASRIKAIDNEERGLRADLPEVVDVAKYFADKGPVSATALRSAHISIAVASARRLQTADGRGICRKMDWNDVERLARDLHLDIEALRGAALPAVAFTPAATSELAVATGSYCGGLPLLPEGAGWPMWSPSRFCEQERATARNYIAQHPSAAPHWTEEIRKLDQLEADGPLPLEFLAQFDLDELATFAPMAPLPHTGKLLVFAEFRSSGAAAMGRADPTPPWRLLWVASDERRALGAPPPQRYAEGFVSPPHSMSPMQVLTFPETVVRHGEVVYGVYHDEAYTDFIEALDGMRVRGRNQVGGHVFRLQDGDIPSRVNRRHDGYDLWTPPPDDRFDRTASGTPSWEFLFQIAEDYGDACAWSGVASFWGRPHETSAGDFEEVELYFEDT